jgi:cell division protein FtsL
MDKTQLRRALQIGAAILVAVLAIGLYKAKTDAAHADARVREMQTQIADTEAEMRALRAEIARAESPANIEAMARTHLGLAAGGQAPALPNSAIDANLPAPRQAATSKSGDE